MLNNVKLHAVKCFKLETFQHSNIPTFQHSKLKGNNNNINKLGEYPNLEVLDCNNNKITSIVDYSKLLELYCHSNQIITFSNLHSITVISCYDNKTIKKIPYFMTLKELVCDYGKIMIHKSYNVKEGKVHKDILCLIF